MGLNMFDPLYPKSLGSQVPNRTFDSVPKEDQTVLVEDNVEEAASDVVESIAPCAQSGEEPVPESWDQRLDDLKQENRNNATDDNAQATKTDSSSEGSGDQEDSVDTTANPKNANDEDIVLGPGSMWGRPFELKPMTETFRPAFKTNDANAPVAAAWKLPSLSQPWKFSEIEHHGRRKKKAKKKKKDGDDSLVS